MNFGIQRRTFYSFDGRALLRASFMSPLVNDSPSQGYISEFVSACEVFAEEKLYPALLKKHAYNYNNQKSGSVYFYEVTVEETYRSNLISSYVILSVLKYKGETLASGVKAVSFDEERIIPYSLISRKIKYKKHSLAYGSDGMPIMLSISNGNLKSIKIL